MGDMVERALEETIPILRSAKKSKLLTAAEISEVVRQRRDHEYRLRGRDVPRAAFLEYAAFEKELAGLLSTRAKARNLKRSRTQRVVGPTAARANLVYSRAVKRFKGDVNLWLYYARHCVDSGANRAAAKVFARAIAMRPDAPEVWLAAIAFHFDTCGDVTIARKIAQRALRAVPDAKQVWREYFRMELAFLAKAVARRIVIRIPVPNGEEKEEVAEKEEDAGDAKGEAHANADSEPVVAVEGADATDAMEESCTAQPEAVKDIAAAEHIEVSGSEEEEEEDEPNSESESEASEPETPNLPRASLNFWQGGVPLAIFRQGKRSVALDVSELLEYWKIAAQMAYSPALLVRRIAEDIDSCTADVHAVAAMLARLKYDVAVAQLQHTLPPKVIALEMLNGPAPIEQDTSVYDAAVTAVKAAAPQACTALAEVLRDAAPATDAMTKLLMDVVQTFLETAGKHLEAEAKQSLCDELSAMQKRHELKASGPDMSKMTLEEIAKNGSHAAWSYFLGASKDATPKHKEEIRKVLKESVAVPFRNKEQDSVAALWVSWEDSYVKTAEAVHALTAVPPLSKLVLETAIESMKSFLTQEGGDEGRRDITSMLRELYAKVTSLKASENDVDLWIDYSEFERVVCANAANSYAVVWKAKKVLSATNTELFTEKLCLRNLVR